MIRNGGWANRPRSFSEAVTNTKGLMAYNVETKSLLIEHNLPTLPSLDQLQFANFAVTYNREYMCFSIQKSRFTRNCNKEIEAIKELTGYDVVANTDSLYQYYFANEEDKVFAKLKGF